MSEILVVDDERTLREGMKMTLQGEGYGVRTARDGADALNKIAEKRPDLVLLDVMMPKMNGFRCCEEIRRTDALLPVLFLTAKESDADQVRGIGLGADDYISKTVSDTILLARIGRALSRVKASGERVGSVAGKRLSIGSVTVDLFDGSVRNDGREVAVLTKTEIDLLRALDANRGEYLVIDDLITELRGNGYACEDSMVYAHLYHLRQKLGSAGDAIVNKRGVGYQLKDN